MLTDRCVVVTGGTGSLGHALVQRLLRGDLGLPGRVVVFSRDEAKQHAMRLAFHHRPAATDDIVYGEASARLEFRIGDVCDYSALLATLRDADIVIHAAALKQVPTCEYFPFEAVKTNVMGPENLVRAIREHRLPVQAVVAVSTDKACKPVNVMGLTKALQERILCRAALDMPDTRLAIARYGNVLASRGSVVPLFHEQIRRGGPVTITLPEMTRFLIGLDASVDTVFSALQEARSGETYVPRAPAVRILDVARALIGERRVEIRCTGVRPGEKVHEVLISEEEATRTVERGSHYAIAPLLPELRGSGEPRVQFGNGDTPAGEYSSSNCVLEPDQVADLLREHGLRVEDEPIFRS